MGENNICIWGMGENGIRLFFFMLQIGMNNIVFGDNDESKQGDTFLNVQCYSMSDLMDKFGDSILIIVTPSKYSNTIIYDLKKKGFINIEEDSSFYSRNMLNPELMKFIVNKKYEEIDIYIKNTNLDMYNALEKRNEGFASIAQ